MTYTVQCERGGKMATRLRRLTIALLLAAVVAPAPSRAADTDRWQPAPGSSWQIQISSVPETILAVEVYDVDLFETPESLIDQMRREDIRVICYFSAGSYENWRPDKDAFAPGDLGKPLSGWPGERWLNIRSENVKDIMTARMDLAVSKGCDAVDPDNVDGYSNKNGLSLTAAEQRDYNQWLADTAHGLGLAVGLKNDLEQVAELAPSFDFAVNEQCVKYRECDLLAPFVDAGKPVFHIEYAKPKKVARVCRSSAGYGLDTLVKRMNLGDWRHECPADA